MTYVPTSETVDLHDRNEYLARQAQRTRQWIYGRHHEATKLELVLVGLDGSLVRVPVSKCRVSHSDIAIEPCRGELIGCWSGDTSTLPTTGYMGPRTAWDYRVPASPTKPRAVVWVIGDPLHVTAIDTIEDSLVLCPGDDPDETIDHLRRVNRHAVDHGTQHLLVRTHSRRPSLRALDREIEYGRALVGAIERTGTTHVPCAWLPTEATIRPSELAVLAMRVADLLDDLTLGPNAVSDRGLDHEYGFQDRAGW